MSRSAAIRGIGHAVPEKILTNADLEALVDTNDEWIVQRTGIRERRICGPNEGAADLAAGAGRAALERAGIPPEDVDMIIVGTVTADDVFPSCACVVQELLGCVNAGAMDVGAACAGFIYAAEVGATLIAADRCHTVLVIGVDVLTKLLDWTDRSTCILFGDGAGAIVMQSEDLPGRGILNTVLSSKGSGSRLIRLTAGGSAIPHHKALPSGESPYIFMNGSETFRFAVGAIGDACERVIREAGLEPEDVDLYVPHQANIRIIESAAERLGMPMEKVFINIEKYGNTSAASVPIGLSEAWEQGLLTEGKLVLTVGFGAGLVWGANLIRF
jgi:3-oxoacyl-[acyl-carrier-protein] synthase-3